MPPLSLSVSHKYSSSSSCFGGGGGCNGGNGDGCNPFASLKWGAATTASNNGTGGSGGIEEAEKVISEGMTNMSMNERENVLHDLHGVSSIHQEDPDMVAKCIQEMNEVLARKSSSNNNNNNNSSNHSLAFHYAWTNHREYVQSLFMMFLRCYHFQVEEASNRLMKHFEMKSELFGLDKVGRHIMIDDFSDDDLKCLRQGPYQILPVRDRAGRVVFVTVFYQQVYKQKENLWRALFYINMTMCLDQETQIKGCTVIVYNVEHSWFLQDTTDQEMYAGLMKVKAYTPIRVVAIHYCFSDVAFGPMVAFISRALERHVSVRTKLHRGSHVETQYELLTYGLPRRLPISTNGQLQLKQHHKFIRTRQLTERQQQQQLNQQSNEQLKQHVIVPSHADVLFGSGIYINTHLGNTRFGMYIEDLMAEYVSTRMTCDKQLLIQRVYEKIQAGGGAFLKQSTTGSWIVVDKKTAIDKIGHGFRNRKTKKPTLQHKTPSSSSSSSSTFLTSTMNQANVSMTSLSSSVVAEKRRISFTVKNSVPPSPKASAASSSSSSVQPRRAPTIRGTPQHTAAWASYAGDDSGDDEDIVHPTPLDAKKPSSASANTVSSNRHQPANKRLRLLQKEVEEATTTSAALKTQQPLLATSSTTTRTPAEEQELFEDELDKMAAVIVDDSDADYRTVDGVLDHDDTFLENFQQIDDDDDNLIGVVETTAKGNSSEEESSVSERQQEQELPLVTRDIFSYKNLTS